jgi:hypothetical protein
MFNLFKLARPDEVANRGGGSMSRRHQRTANPNLDKSFRHLPWTWSGGRTGGIDGYRATGRRFAS